MDALSYLSAIALDLEVTCLDLSMQRPSIHPYAYRTRIPLFTTFVTTVFTLLLLLLYYSYYKTVATDKLL